MAKDIFGGYGTPNDNEEQKNSGNTESVQIGKDYGGNASVSGDQPLGGVHGNDGSWNDWASSQSGNDWGSDSGSWNDNDSSSWDNLGGLHEDAAAGNDKVNQNNQQAAQPQPQNEAERVAAAQAQNQYTQEALSNLQAQQQAAMQAEMKTVDRNDEAAMWALYQKYYDENGNLRTQAAPAQQSATAAVNAAFTATPTQQQQTQQPVNSNLKQIIDPNKGYGRTGVPGAKYNSYVYSYDAKQLQNQLNREIFQHNRDIASGKIPGTAADYIKPLKEDGLMGYQTLTTMQKLGYDTSGVKGWTDYNAQRQQQAQKTGTDFLTEAYNSSQTNSSPAGRNQNTPEMQAFYGSVLNSNGFVNGVSAQTNDAYMRAFQDQFEALQRQFPNYTFDALTDIIMENEHQRNGNSPFYRWIAGQR